MIAAYTAVPGLKWGVMIPQPISELKERVYEDMRIVLLMAALGIVLAAFVSWWLAGYIAKPMQAVAGAAEEIAGGKLSTEVTFSRKFMPGEIYDLANAFNDMSRRVESNTKRLRAARRDAEKANASKSEFLANMSHDLRTPLNAIMGFSDVMRNEVFGKLEAKYHEYVGDITYSAQLLESLINDILDISKIEAGKYELACDPVHLPELIDVSVRQLQTAASNAGHNLEVELEGELPVMLGDERALIQIFNNLISNAIKYTDKGW